VYKYGGIYLDVNTEIIKDLDIFLNDQMFIGFEQDNKIAAGMFGAKKRHPVIGNALKGYKKERLLNKNNEINFATINDRVQPELIKLGLTLDNSPQKLNGVTVYPKEYFNPRYWNSSAQDKITSNTYMIHYYGASWHNKITKEKLNKITKFN
jgi:mannosyltransferase OCH1-like enzyme